MYDCTITAVSAMTTAGRPAKILYDTQYYNGWEAAAILGGIVHHGVRQYFNGSLALARNMTHESQNATLPDATGSGLAAYRSNS